MPIRLWLPWLAAAAIGAACRGEPEEPELRQSLREATLTAEVRSRILAVEMLKALPVRVRTRGTTVALSGSVHDSTQVETVRGIAAAVRGVERVDVNLRVVPPPDTTRAGRGRRSSPAEPPPALEEPLPSLEEAG
ncbi:MAG: BON domain-containing protein [Gemmatimonadota bacterium]